MNNRPSSAILNEPNESWRAGSAQRATLVVLGILLAFDVFSTYNYLVSGLSQHLYAMLLAYLATLCVGISLWMIRRNWVNGGVWGVILTTLVALLLSPLLGSGLGLVYALTAIIVATVLGGQGLGARQAFMATAVGSVFGVATYLLDVSLPASGAAGSAFGVYAMLFILAFALALIVASQFRTYTLRAKLTIVFLLVSIVPLIVLTSINYFADRDMLTASANEGLSNAATMTAYQLDAYFAQNLNVIRSDALLPDLIEYLSLPENARADSPEQAQAQKLINALMRQDTIYSVSVSALDVNGKVVADTYSPNINSDRSGEDYFREALRTGLPYVSAVKFNPQTGAPSLYFSVPVRDSSGRIIGVLTKQYNASVLQVSIVRNNGLAGTASFPILLDANYVILASGAETPPIYKSVTRLDAAAVSALQANGALPPGKPEELSANLPDFETRLNQAEAQPFFAVELHDEADSDIEQVAVAKMTTQPWIVAFVQPQEVFLTRVNARVRNNVLTTIFVSLAVAVLGFLVSQRVSAPIVRLTETAEAIHAGDLDLTVAVESRDEIGKLAESFNDMTLQLRGLILSLEERVAERTAAAEAARAESESARMEAESARKDLETQFWLANGQSQLADAIRGEQTLAQLAANVLTQVCEYVGAQAGALYLLEGGVLNLIGGYAYVARPGFDGKIPLGEGLVGQAAAEGKFMFADIPAEALIISTGLADIVPRQMVAVPFLMNGKVLGVIEIATLAPFSREHLELWKRVSETIGAAFHTVLARKNLSDLLLESRRQAEELQSQEEELRAVNEELLAQAENLKAAREAK